MTNLPSLLDRLLAKGDQNKTVINPQQQQSQPVDALARDTKTSSYSDSNHSDDSGNDSSSRISDFDDFCTDFDLVKDTSEQDSNDSSSSIAVNDDEKEHLHDQPSQLPLLPWLEVKRAKAAAQPHHLCVRVFDAQTRIDVAGVEYTAYLVSIKERLENNTIREKLLERRYSEFYKLYTHFVRKHLVKLDAGFPSKHWAGRVGHWTPSVQWAPDQHQQLIRHRVAQLDIWFVHLMEKYNYSSNFRNSNNNNNSNKDSDDVLPDPVYDAVTEFIANATLPPCDQVNEASHEQWKWNNPFSCTLGASIRQAAATMQHMIINNNSKYKCHSDYADADQSIPLDLLQAAQALVFMTVFKAGFGVSGRFGTGLVVTRLGHDEDGMCEWSSPVALGTVGLGWGALAGADVTHYLIVLTSGQAVIDLVSRKSLQLGAELGVAVGPVGRGANSHLQTSNKWTLHPAYAYAHSQGLFVGMSLEGSVVTVRHDVNAKFYGRPMDRQAALELLQKRPGPKAAEPLYKALNQALNATINNNAFRPSVALLQATEKLKQQTSFSKESRAINASLKTKSTNTPSPDQDKKATLGTATNTTTSPSPLPTTSPTKQETNDANRIDSEIA